MNHKPQTKKPSDINEFKPWLSEILRRQDFVQLSLGKPRRIVEDLPETENSQPRNFSGKAQRGIDGSIRSTAITMPKRALLRPVTVKEGDRLMLVVTEPRRDLTKILTTEEALDYVSSSFGRVFLSATVKTLERDIFLEISKSGALQVGSATPSTKKPVSTSHNREKRFELSPDLPWLTGLGISNSRGELRSEMRDKFIQIERFVNILRPELEKLTGTTISAVDVGSGKSYLTFALFQLLQNLKPDAKITVVGVEKRGELVTLSNTVAKESGFQDGSGSELRFVTGIAEDLIRNDSEIKAEIVVALHACDTATDDAIAFAIQHGAKLICAAPCCHKYVRKKMHAIGPLAHLTRFGIHAERIGETVTDALRALHLEAHGYETKVAEFIDKSHTAKNTIVIGTRASGESKSSAFRDKAKKAIEDLQAACGISDFYLNKK